MKAVVGYVSPFSPVDVQGEDLQWVGICRWRSMKSIRQGWRAPVSMKADSLNELATRRRDAGRSALQPLRF